MSDASSEARTVAVDGAAKLLAEDALDLAVIAAALQDARTKVRDALFEPDENRFALLLNRYRRERPHDPATCQGLTETDCVLVFECIKEVYHRGMGEVGPDDELSMLTIALEPGGKYLYHVDLVFENDRQVQLRSDCLDCRLEDVGDPRGCAKTPCDHFKDEPVLGAGLPGAADVAAPGGA